MAEDALQAGRLDEALELATSPQLAGHRKARHLLSRLCEPLLRRAQEHLIAARFTDALADIERAARCGVARERVEDWRQRALAAMQGHQRDLRDRRAALEAAEDRIAAGHLTLAHEHLAGVGDDTDAARLVQRAARQAERAKAELADARQALDRSDIARAVQHWAAARREHPGADDLPELEAEIGRVAIEQAREALSAGRLDRLCSLLSQLGDVGRGSAELAELRHIVELAQQAAAAVHAGRYGDASVALGRLNQIAPDLAWAAAAREHLREIESRRTILCEGPLGLLMDHPAGGGDCVRPVTDETLPAAGPVRAPPVVGDIGLAARLVLRIDGVGSFLVFRGERMRIGRAGPGASADLPLVSDLPEDAAEIVRSDDDYFLVSVGGAAVGGRPVRQSLLNHGDRIQLGAGRVRLTFRRPCLKSATAVLDLGSGVRTITDVRRVVLLNGPLLLGGSSECHIPLPAGSLVLSERGGQLYVWTLTLTGATAESSPLPPGQLIEIGGVRMSLQTVGLADPAGQAIG